MDWEHCGLGCPRNEQKKFRFEPKQTETRSVSRLFRFVSWNKQKNFQFVSVFRTYIETTETNRAVSKRTERIRNFMKDTFICSLSKFSKFSWTEKMFSLKKIKTRRKNLPKHSISYCIWRCRLLNKRNSFWKEYWNKNKCYATSKNKQQSSVGCIFDPHTLKAG